MTPVPAPCPCVSDTSARSARHRHHRAQTQHRQAGPHIQHPPPCTASMGQTLPHHIQQPPRVLPQPACIVCAAACSSSMLARWSATLASSLSVRAQCVEHTEHTFAQNLTLERAAKRRHQHQKQQPGTELPQRAAGDDLCINPKSARADNEQFTYT